MMMMILMISFYFKDLKDLRDFQKNMMAPSVEGGIGLYTSLTRSYIYQFNMSETAEIPRYSILRTLY